MAATPHTQPDNDQPATPPTAWSAPAGRRRRPTPNPGSRASAPSIGVAKVKRRPRVGREGWGAELGAACFGGAPDLPSAACGGHNLAADLGRLAGVCAVPIGLRLAGHMMPPTSLLAVPADEIDREHS